MRGARRRPGAAPRGGRSSPRPDAVPAAGVLWPGLSEPQERVDTHDPVPVVGDEGVAFDPLVEGNPSRLQPTEPRLAHEFAVGQQDGDPLRAEDREEALHQGLALGGVGVARLARDAPEHRHGDAATGDPQHQEIDVHLAELPVGAIHRQPPRAIADRDQAHQQPRPIVRVDLERAEEALQTLVVRVHLGRAAETGGQFGQVDAAHLEQGQQELREKPDPGAVPRQMFGQHRFEFVDGVVGGSLHWSACKKCLA